MADQYLNDSIYDGMYDYETEMKSDSLNSIISKIKKANQADELLSTYLKDLQSKTLNKKTKKIFKKCMQLRSDFWVLLWQTKRFLKVDKDDAYEACTSLKHLAQVIQENETFDNKILSEAFQPIKQIITNKQKNKQRSDLQIRWHKWIQKFYDLQKVLIDITEDHLPRNLLIGFAVFLGVAAVVSGVITCGVSTAATIIVAGAFVSEEFFFAGGIVCSLWAAHGYHESKPSIEKTLQQMNVVLEKQKQVAMQFDCWFQDIVANGDSGRRWMKKLQNTNGKAANDYIDLLRKEFEKWRTVCEKAYVAVKDVQMKMVNK